MPPQEPRVHASEDRERARLLARLLCLPGAPIPARGFWLTLTV